MDTDMNPEAQQDRAALADHARRLQDVRTRDLFHNDPARVDDLSLSLAGMFVDFSKNRVDQATMASLVALARSTGVEQWRSRMFSGDIVNLSENRPALHVALRDSGTEATLGTDGTCIRTTVSSNLAQMRRMVEDLRHRKWPGATDKPVTDVIHMGIGGSILGPAAVVHALHKNQGGGPRIHFVSNVDAAALMPVLRHLNPETTLVVIVSKSFTTLETLTNARTAREWLLQHIPADGLHRHLIAVTAKPERAEAFGVDRDNVMTFGDWVGGRFSLWSAVGLPIALSTGMDVFMRLLKGARQMDTHFRTAPLGLNIPVVLALIGIWNANYQAISAHAVLPYDDRLDGLPAHIQQLEMESTGKSVDRHGRPLDWKTAPIVFGMSGTDAQHTFFQAVHQGTRAVSTDFIGCLRDDYDNGTHHKQLLANMFAQSEALMVGWWSPRESEHRERICRGNRPSTTILLDSLEPENLGMLLALYEHKVFVQGVVWGINPFDQWGVELGKKLTDRILENMAAGSMGDHDASTSGLISRFMQSRREGS